MKVEKNKFRYHLHVSYYQRIAFNEDELNKTELHLCEDIHDCLEIVAEISANSDISCVQIFEV